jgi:hypothetical protein
LALPLEEEDEKPRIDDPAERYSEKSIKATTFKQRERKRQKSILSSYKAHTLGKG